MVFVIRENSKLSRPLTAKVIKADQVWAFKQIQEAIADGERQRAELIFAGQESYDRELQKAYAEGMERAQREQVGNIIEMICHTMQYFSKVESQMVELVVAAVRRIIDEFDDRVRVISLVKQSLTLVRTQKQLRLRVHSSQIELVRIELNNLLKLYPAVEFIDLSADDMLANDACIIESDIGTIESTVSGQINALRESFFSALGGDCSD